MSEYIRRSIAIALLSAIFIAGGAVGCLSTREAVDPEIATAARQSVRQRQNQPTFEDFDDEDYRDETHQPGSIGDVIVAELLAIFPGIIIHGAGHWYAGDKDTANKLSRIGQFGYLLTAAGGGLAYGGYLLYDEVDELQGLGISLMTGGGFIGAAGVFYLGTAWVYDLIDTPRAVFSGGRPPPRSKFVDSLDIFGD